MHLLHTEAATAKRLCLQGKRAVGDSKMKNREKGHTAVVGLGGSCSVLVQESLLSYVARSICVKGSTGKKQMSIWCVGSIGNPDNLLCGVNLCTRPN